MLFALIQGKERERERERERETSAITTSQALASQHSKHERSKRRQYEQGVREVEGVSFVPLVFSTAGGMGPACTTTLKRLASIDGFPVYVTAVAWQL